MNKGSWDAFNGKAGRFVLSWECGVLLKNTAERCVLLMSQQADSQKTGDLRIDQQKKDYRTGLLCVLLCQVSWGFLPVFWNLLDPIPSGVIILYRIVTMFLCSYAVARLRYSRAEVWGPFRQRRIRWKYIAAGFVLTINWSIYIWAVTSGRIIQATIGYYIEPLVICLVGILFFKEKLTRFNIVAMAFALAAILIILLHFGQLPGAALGLAVSWAIYSAIKKTSVLPNLIALVYETLVFAVLAFPTLLYLEGRGLGALSLHMPGKYALLFLTGLVTLVPVALFSAAARKVPLFIIGLAQYISPSLQLLLGIFLYREPVDRVQMFAFLLIWIGLVIFSCGELKNSRRG